METQYGVAVNTGFLAGPATDLIGHFRSSITGFVVSGLTDSSDNAALTYIAGQAESELLVAVAKPATQALASLDAYSPRSATPLYPKQGDAIDRKLESIFPDQDQDTPPSRRRFSKAG